MTRRRQRWARRLWLPVVVGMCMAAVPAPTAIDAGRPATASRVVAPAPPVEPVAVTAAPAPSVALLDDARSLVAALRRAPTPVVPAAVLASPAAPAATRPAPVAAPTRPTRAPALSHHEAVGREALSRLRHVEPAALGWDVQFHPGRDGYLGLADWEARVIHVWVRDRHDVTDVLGTLAHEFAHVYDYEHWTTADRKQWLRLRGLDIEWWPSCTCDDRAFGAGDIAEALVVLEAGRGEWTGHYGMPTTEQLEWLRSRL